MRVLPVVLCVIALCIHGATAQAVPADHVVISEVELNPAGADIRKEWVEIYNPTGQDVDIGGWKIVSSSQSRALNIPAGTTISSGQYQAYSHYFSWLADSSESIRLADSQAETVDVTPVINDTADDDTSWQRTDSKDHQWIFDRSSKGMPNKDGQDGINTISVTTDKQSYQFGETATISGDVYKKTSPDLFFAGGIVINVTGPDYNRVITKYPDLFLKYSTSLNLHEVLGIKEGTYRVEAAYAGATEAVEFSVGRMTSPEDMQDRSVLQIQTDMHSYIPGDRVFITAHTDRIIQLEGLELVVTDPDGMTVFKGTLFADPVSQSSKTGGRFLTTMDINTISPAYGKYDMVASYGAQIARTNFTVQQDLSSSESFADTEMPAYEPGENVVIHGRLAQHTHMLDIEIVRAANLDFGRYVGSGLKTNDAIRVAGDSTFRYEIPIPENFEHFGKYRVILSGNVDTLVTTFDIVMDRDSHVAPDAPLHIRTDRQAYSLQDSIRISGTVDSPAVQGTHAVEIKIFDESGRAVSFTETPQEIIEKHGDGRQDLVLTPVPDSAGGFYVDVTINRLLFEPGTYTIHAVHQGHNAKADFEIKGDGNRTLPVILATTDKKVYGLGETVYVKGTFGAQVGSGHGVSITVHKPDGKTDRYGTIMEDGMFSWNWNTPRFESTDKAVKRTVTNTNIGTYRINIETGDTSADLFFRVSANPDSEIAQEHPITITTEKQDYQQGDALTVSGQVAIKHETGRILVPHLVGVKIYKENMASRPIYEANVYPRHGGTYESIFQLAPTVFTQGTYMASAKYDNKVATTSFTITDNFALGGTDPARIILDMETKTYNPGQTLVLNGKPSKIIHVKEYDISVAKKSDIVDCGPYYCGKHTGPVTALSPDQYSGFSFKYDIPMQSRGTYEITVDGGFDTKRIVFDVVKPAIVKSSNVITGSSATISPETVLDGHDVKAVKMSGSLLVAPRSQGAVVNLQIDTAGGTCIIGQLPQCHVSGPTGETARKITLEDAAYSIRYSGPDAGFEGFAIMPESGAALPAGPFEVSILKDGQATRFHYKITYE